MLGNIIDLNSLRVMLVVVSKVGRFDRNRAIQCAHAESRSPLPVSGNKARPQRQDSVWIMDGYGVRQLPKEVAAKRATAGEMLEVAKWPWAQTLPPRKCDRAGASSFQFPSSNMPSLRVRAQVVGDEGKGGKPWRSIVQIAQL